MKWTNFASCLLIRKHSVNMKSSLSATIYIMWCQSNTLFSFVCVIMEGKYNLGRGTWTSEILHIHLASSNRKLFLQPGLQIRFPISLLHGWWAVLPDLDHGRATARKNSQQQSCCVDQPRQDTGPPGQCPVHQIARPLLVGSLKLSKDLTGPLWMW